MTNEGASIVCVQSMASVASPMGVVGKLEDSSKTPDMECIASLSL